MADPCKQSYFVGKLTAVEFSLACGDEDPRELEFLPIGAMRGKTLNLGGDTTDATTDSTVGEFRENMMLFKTFDFSGDGLMRLDDGTRHNQTLLKKYWFNTQQPAAWFRYTMPDITIYAYQLITSFSMESPHDDLMSFSLETQTTASDFGVIQEDTPQPVTSVTISPAGPLMLEHPDTEQLTATTDPSGREVTWSSSDELVATVSGSGLVTTVGEGSAVITATSGMVSGIVNVTVTDN